MPILDLIEIRNTAAQGVTKPVFCVGADNHTYLVKGAYAGNVALINEWIASRLGQFAGIPIPRCALLRLPPEMFAYSAQREELSLLGRGTLFGSLWQRDMVELRMADIANIDLPLRATILAFDHWIGNGDRTLSPHGGNPNLLWSPSESRLAVIDHNMAFDYTDSSDSILHHVFFEAKATWSNSFRFETERRFVHALSKFDQIFGEIPLDWIEAVDGEIHSKIKASLSRFQNDPARFWS